MTDVLVSATPACAARAILAALTGGDTSLLRRELDGAAAARCSRSSSPWDEERRELLGAIAEELRGSMAVSGDGAAEVTLETCKGLLAHLGVEPVQCYGSALRGASTNNAFLLPALTM